MSVSDAPLPRYDFYQTPVHLIVSLYVKGYNSSDLAPAVQVAFQPHSVEIQLPPLPGSSASSKTRLNVSPLFAPIQPEASSFRILSSKIELKLLKVDTETWPALFATPTGPSDAGPSRTTQLPPTARSPSAVAADHDDARDRVEAAAAEGRKEVQDARGGREGKDGKGEGKRRNWDKIVGDELDEPEASGPNSGGDAALQALFAKIYADADADTKRAMIKSFTESGGTALSTDWSDVGKKTVPIRPPDGMEAKKY